MQLSHPETSTTSLLVWTGCWSYIPSSPLFQNDLIPPQHLLFLPTCWVHSSHKAKKEAHMPISLCKNTSGAKDQASNFYSKPTSTVKMLSNENFWNKLQDMELKKKLWTSSINPGSLTKIQINTSMKLKIKFLSINIWQMLKKTQTKTVRNKKDNPWLENGF